MSSEPFSIAPQSIVESYPSTESAPYMEGTYNAPTYSEPVYESVVQPGVPVGGGVGCDSYGCDGSGCLADLVAVPAGRVAAPAIMDATLAVTGAPVPAEMAATMD